ncbi:MAG: hypothetical protein ACK4NX_02285, partial [Candidatus Paceibacteria bacterium]
YENFSHEYTLNKNNNLDTAEALIKENKTPHFYNTPEQYFYNLAKYTNGNFFSKDTILLEKYKLPTWINEKIIKDADGNFIRIGYTNLDQPLIILTKAKTWLEIINDKKENHYINDKFILSSYFSNLSQQSVLHGAGLLNLFFQEVEKAKQNPELAEKPIENAKVGVISPFGEYARFKNLVQNTFKNIASSLIAGFSNEEISSIEGDLLKPVVEEINSQMSLNQTGDIVPQTEVLSQNSAVESVINDQLIETPQQTITQEIVMTKPDAPAAEPIKPRSDSGKTSPQPLTDSFGLFAAPAGAGFGGGGESATGNSESSISADTVPPAAPLIASPLDFNQTFTSANIVFQGTAEASSTLKAAYSLAGATTTATTTVSESGFWSLSLSLGQSTTTISFYAIDSSNNTSSSTQISLFVDSLAPGVSSFSISECMASLSSDGCLVATTTLRLSWNSLADDLDYYELSYGPNVATTAATSTTLTFSDWSNYTFSLRAKDKTGNWSSATTTSAEIATLPVVINEIAWAGTSASSSDEWVELYNNTSKT